MYRIQSIKNPDFQKIPDFYQPGFLFLESRHLCQQACTPFYYFALVGRKKTALARCALFIHNNWAVSPCAASFGSIEMADEVPDDVLLHFVLEILRSCRISTFAGIRLVHYPDCYAPTQCQRIRKALLTAGFQVRYEEVNQHLTVTDQPLVNRLHPSERRRLRKCQNAGFTSGIWKNPDTDALFQFIARARRRKNQPITIDPATLSQLLYNFPNDMIVFDVRHHHELIAACLGVRITSNILYYFVPADHEAFLAYSPMVLLIDTLYRYCQQETIQLLDLGISTCRGIRNEGLLTFKSRLGADISSKNTFEMCW